MKKRGRLISIIFVVLIISFFIINVHAQVPSGTLDPKDLEEAGEKIKEFTEKDRFEFLAEQWREILLKNKFIAPVDSFLREINIIFVILFGENYDLSLILFLVILTWIFFLLSFSSIFEAYTAFSKWAAIAIGLGFNIIVAQLGIFRLIANGALTIAFYREGIWRWISLILFVTAVVVFFIVARKFAQIEKEHKKAKAELKQKLNQKVLDTTAKAILKAHKESS